MSVSPDVIARIHRSGWQFVTGITGGGSQAIGDLLSVPGGSQSLLEAIVPYSWPALVEFLGGKPDQACSERTARAMAMAAWERARQLAEPDFDVQHLLGIGCTASLASDRPKHGEHRVHLAFQSAESTFAVSRVLEKGLRTRAEEERIVADLLVNWLAGGVDAQDATWGDNEETGTGRLYTANSVLKQLLLGKTPAAFLPRCEFLPVYEPLPDIIPRIVFPGAFNPVHEAHLRMAEIATERLGAPTTFELSIENVDKPPLDYLEISDRVARFPITSSLCLTRAPTFVRKSAIFPGATFLVGADTIVRIADPKYADNTLAGRDEVLATIAQRGCRFLVFGRTADGQFKTLQELSLPSALLAICEQISENEFRWDLSSTQLRQQAAQQQ